LSQAAIEALMPATPPIDANFRAGLARLRQAYRYAEDTKDTGRDPWDFALEIDTLYKTGMTISDLRWLVAKAYAEHGEETFVHGAAHRSFRKDNGLNFFPTTCFVLTPEGVKFVDGLPAPPAGS